jgi:hypothetical protein
MFIPAGGRFLVLTFSSGTADDAADFGGNSVME